MPSFVLLAFLLLVGLSNLANFAAAKRLAGTGNHFLVLQRDGQVFAVGYNRYGQLGLNTATNVLLPQAMLFVTNASDISTGYHHSCLIDSQVKCVGFNLLYQLGDGTDTDRSLLVPTLGLDSGIQEVYCGYYGSCARMTSGKAQCWGQFANVVRTSPVSITVSGGIQSISLGSFHACLVKVGGGLYCMGSNANGQLGTGNKTDQPTPTPVVGLAAENIVSVACGYYHTCAVNAAGAIFCWGELDNGRLGNPSITSDSPNPVQVTGITSGAASAWAGWYNSFVLMQNGTVWAFGKDGYGLFGTGSTGNQPVPIVFGQGVSGVVEVRGGILTTCVLLQNDRVWCTGRNQNGQLGVGSITSSLTLVEMQLPTLAPTRSPTKTPTKQPTFASTKQPTLIPTKQPTLIPTKQPTLISTAQPTLIPTAQPTSTPSAQPTLTPSAQPATTPTTPSPTKRPTKAPTATPTKRPTKAPTTRPTKRPTGAPTKRPTKAPTAVLTKRPTNAPTKRPTKAPTAALTKRPATAAPTKRPTNAPTKKPTKALTNAPTKKPTKAPTAKPTKRPTKAPTKKPTTAKPVAAS
ncbi:hypothetical protein BASA81_002324 [Batrachochytrium salamandrivorans]|nr:hypothetical protein BASA81_002324 [Batrachochytrium salamandrivorans]